ncbi:hypothetical protein [Flavobacterium ginsengiterrae]|uniref:Endosialidase-like protein n=1 Tax=Flavobacterium ginsengiterrae TaxID=871695 RepID=A0ABP7GQQ2_9FLAO
MKKTQLILLYILLSFNMYSQSLNPTFSISSPGMADAFKGGYTFSYSSAGTPWTGSLISYGGFEYNNYDTQISSDYGRNRISFRTRNGDHNYWNPWNEIITSLGDNYFAGNQNVGGTLSIDAYQSTSPFSVGNNHGVKLSIGNSLWSNTAIIQTGYTAQIGDFTDLKVASYGYSDGLIRILQNGNVGIGATKPDSKLTVAGNIHAQEVKVTVNAGMVPDYVFANDYKLKTLKEVEQYIKENSHLPEIPSAHEIEKNGLMMAEMNMNLLKKIEELTLYLINKDKQINFLLNENALIKKNNDDLKKTLLERLEKLEAKAN